MEFEISIANCISNERLQEEDVKCISDLLSRKKISLEDVVSSLESELVSPISSQKKRGIEIIEQLLWSYLPNKDFTTGHIKLVCCFVLNYISDWACVDSVVGIIKCILSCEDAETLKQIRIDIRDDETVRDEYSFSPIIALKQGQEEGEAGRSDFGPGRMIGGGRYLKSYAEICSYHKFNNHFGIKDAESDEDLYCMSIVFYLVTQVLYRAPTRQLIYTSRIKIVDLLLFVFGKRDFHSELERLGPGVVPIVVQHIENEKDPRVLIKAFPLIQHVLEDFQEIISLYDSNVTRESSGSGERGQSGDEPEFDLYQLYKGRVPRLSDDERQGLELRHGSKEAEEAEETRQESGSDLSSGGSSGILSGLVSEVLFSYFPLQFQSPTSQLPRLGAVSPKDLKSAYFSVITCSSLTQDSLVQAIVEYMDTQGLLESMITSYEDLNFGDEGEFRRYLDSSETSNQLTNKPIHLRQPDQDILSESLSLLSMINYEIDPKVINKYISSIFLLIGELLKNIVISTEQTNYLLLRVLFIFINHELRFKNGREIINTALSRSVIPKLLLKLSSDQQLDAFALNILDIFVLTRDSGVIRNITESFLLVDIAKNDTPDRIHINSKLLVTLYILADAKAPVLESVSSAQDVQLSGEICRPPAGVADSFRSRVCEFLESAGIQGGDESEPPLHGLELSRFCLLLVLECVQNDQMHVLDKLLGALEHHWSNYDQKSEAEKSLIAGCTSLLLFTNRSESRAHWRGYLEARSPKAKDGVPQSDDWSSVLENLMYTVVVEKEAPPEMVSALVCRISSSVLESISGSLSLYKWTVISKRVASINVILRSRKWAGIYHEANLSTKYGQWVGAIIDSISSITDYGLILENKGLFYGVSKGFGVLTYRLWGHFFDLEDQGKNVWISRGGIFDQLQFRLDDASNCWLVFVYINELLAHMLPSHHSKCIVSDRFGKLCNGLLNSRFVSHGMGAAGCERASRLINLEVEKFVISLSVLKKSTGSEEACILDYKGDNEVIRNKILRCNLFNEIGDMEGNYREVKRQLSKISESLSSPDVPRDEAEWRDLLGGVFSMLYITGSDLNLVRNPSSKELSVSAGNFRYLFKRDNVENKAEGESDRTQDQSLFGEMISVMTSCSKINTGKYLLEATKLKISGLDEAEAPSDSALGTKTEVKAGAAGPEESAASSPIEELWPEVISLTDNHPIDLSRSETREKVLAINQAVLESFSGIYPVDAKAERGLWSYPLVLVPVISSMSSLNMRSIIDRFSPDSIQSILEWSLIECTNFTEYRSEKLENPGLAEYLVGKANEGAALSLETRIKEVKRLLMRKRPSPRSEAWTRSMQELQIHNLQSLSLLMRVLHYSRENKLEIYEKRSETRHSFDFVLENLGTSMLSGHFPDLQVPPGVQDKHKGRRCELADQICEQRLQQGLEKNVMHLKIKDSDSK
ncbi:hypothetical protein OJ253_3440 [Cryptosporidium canis]|uniref:MMS19 nucleotide excision repair protein n=1 Tax=Cryptosporidium canis TaxID=195482 RepID=A0A9D5DE57_9CRYT|nr:hypothetical protein OJ253_3440 [Cryptosporidium canis]